MYINNAQQTHTGKEKIQQNILQQLLGSSMLRGLKRAVPTAVLAGAMAASASPANAQSVDIDVNTTPTGETVVGGDVSFDRPDESTLNITQGTARAYIDWQNFDIGANASTNFDQPGQNSIAVNRVTMGDRPTQILGSLTANGQVFILDPNGVYFGKNSRMDVGGILASTGSLDADAFMSGSNSLDLTNIDTGGSIINEGQISVVDGGLAGFVAPHVVNNGIITARLGKVQLAAGSVATLDLYGDQLVEIALTGGAANPLIENAGVIAANGGTVAITARAAEKVVNNIINMDGIIQANAVGVEGGKIVLKAENGGVKVAGVLHAGAP